MILAAVLSVALAGAQPPVDPDPADLLIRDATEWLLNGEDPPADLDLRLRALSPADRLRVLVFLRRSGIYDEPAWPVEQLLAPARAPETP